jgi:hypothetical protein
MHYAYENHIPPKRIDDNLITIKDPPFETYNEEELRAMHREIKVKNYRIFTDDRMIYLFNSETLLQALIRRRYLTPLASVIQNMPFIWAGSWSGQPWQ